MLIVLSLMISQMLRRQYRITAVPQVLLDMVSDPQTEETIEKFSQDWQQMNKM